MCDYAKEAREPKEHRLFHYTRKPEHLEDMIRNGIWPRYCEEKFEWLVGQPVTLAFPMICFCDIPLDATVAHRIRYGDYAISFSKTWAEELDINPLWYVHKNSSIGKRLAASLDMKPRFELAKLDGNIVRALLPFIKPTIGDQPDRSAIRVEAFEVCAFDEEMEWRHTPAALADKWLQHYDTGFLSEENHALSKEYRMKLDIADIDCDYVPRYDDARDLIRKFPELIGKVHVW